MIKAILLDIDGTLTNSKKEITPKTLEALLKVQSKGTRLILCSGRPERGLYKLATQLDMFNNNGILICYNGARVVDCTTKEVLFNQTIPNEKAIRVLEHLKKFEVKRLLEEGDYIYTEDVFDHDINVGTKENPEIFNVLKYEVRMNDMLMCEKRDLVEFLDFDPYKVLTTADPEYLNAHYKEMSAGFEGELNFMFSAPWYFEFTAMGIDKARAIENTMPKLNIKREEVMAFGDAQNDASMIKYAGIGVAMGNAVAETKSVADYVTADNENDGIALALYKFMPEAFEE